MFVRLLSQTQDNHRWGVSVTTGDNQLLDMKHHYNMLWGEIPYITSLCIKATILFEKDFHFQLLSSRTYFIVKLL